MSALHSFKKNIVASSLMFPPDMYTNTFGSIVVSAYMMTEMEDRQNISVPEIIKRWNKIKKSPSKKIDFWLDDPDFIDKTLALFDMKRPKDFPIAMLQSQYNVLFLPYVDGQLLPIREDGRYPMSAKCGKIYPIDFSGDKNEK